MCTLSKLPCLCQFGLAFRFQLSMSSEQLLNKNEHELSALCMHYQSERTKVGFEIHDQSNGIIVGDMDTKRKLGELLGKMHDVHLNMRKVQSVLRSRLRLKYKTCLSLISNKRYQQIVKIVNDEIVPRGQSWVVFLADLQNHRGIVQFVKFMRCADKKLYIGIQITIHDIDKTFRFEFSWRDYMFEYSLNDWAFLLAFFMVSYDFRCPQSVWMVSPKIRKI